MMYLIKADKLDKVRSITEARLIHENADKPVLFKYPAHDVDSFAVVTLDGLEWIHANIEFMQPKENLDFDGIHAECFELAEILNDRVSFEEVEWEPLTKYTHDDGIVLIGTSLTCELDEGYIPPESEGWISVRESVEMAGYSVIDVEYGSRLHNKWNQFIRD